LSIDLKTHFLKSLEIDPNYSESHFELALIFQLEKNFDCSKKHFNCAIKTSIKKIDKIEIYGNQLLKKSQFQNAKHQFYLAQEEKKNCAKYNYYLSKLYHQNKMSKDAIICLEKCIELNPYFSNGFRDLGFEYFKKKNFDEARKLLLKALDLNYKDYKIHYYLGQALISTFDYIDAEQHLLIALDINSNCIDGLIELALLKLKLKDLDSAKKYYKKVKSLNPKLSIPILEKLI
tara:strand:+ start:44 stop:742 length:699 start_codon:yes stop_codon:yes gene_type:complete